MARDPNVSAEKVKRVIALQPDDKEVIEESDIVFENHDVPDDLMIEEIIKLADIIKNQHAQHEAKKISAQVLENINSKSAVKSRIGLVPGSFDPIQLGHLYVIERALQIVDVVHLVVAHNDKKTPYFTNTEKLRMIRGSILERLGPEAMARIIADVLSKDQLLITHAQKKNASLIFRGLRSGFDFDYESAINATQHDIDDSIETVYIMTPAKYTQVSSSLVKTLHLYPDAAPALKKYVTAAVYDELLAKAKK